MFYIFPIYTFDDLLKVEERACLSHRWTLKREKSFGREVSADNSRAFYLSTFCLPMRTWPSFLWLRFARSMHALFFPTRFNRCSAQLKRFSPLQASYKKSPLLCQVEPWKWANGVVPFVVQERSTVTISPALKGRLEGFNSPGSTSLVPPFHSLFPLPVIVITPLWS